jgi:uncharacterized protein with PQ loop repeat
MGNNELNGYLINDVSFPYRILSVKSSDKKKSFLGSLAALGMDIAMVVAPLLTYCFQINKFNKTKSSKGFSKLICFLLFLGNIFRIFFWMGTHFKKTLLYQSIGIVIFQIILIHLCIKYQDNPDNKNFISETKNNNENNQNQNNNNNNIQRPLIYYLTHWKDTFSLKKIWKWKVEIEYYKFMFFIIIMLIILCEIFQKNKIFFHLIGIMSAIFESLTCMPQVIENCKTKNTQNVSFSMIFCWFLGDSFRLYYNIKFKAPIQMIAAISFQVTLDLIVCLQIAIYRRKNNRKEINKIMNKIDEMNISVKKKENDEEINVDLKKNTNGNIEINEHNKNEQKLDQSNTSDPETILK